MEARKEIEATKKVDDLLSVLGTGAWNIFSLVALALWYMMLPAQLLGASFLTPNIPHVCILPPGAKPLSLSPTITPPTTTVTPATTITPDTTLQDLDTTIPPVSEEMSQCEYLMVTNDTEEVLKCTEWDFDNTTYGYTLTEHYNLVCERRFLRPLYQSIYFCGAVFGAIFNGYTSDRFGRKVVVAYTTVGYIILSNILHWVPNYSAMLFIRIIMGYCDAGFIQTGFTLVMEKFQKKHRSIAGILIFFPWVIGLMIFGGLASLIRNWFWLLFVTSLPFLIFLPALWFIDESPRWLIVRGHHDRAFKVLQKAARWNNASLPPEYQLRKLMADITEGSHKLNRDEGLRGEVQLFFTHLFMLFRTRRMLKRTLCSVIALFVTGMGYYGLSLSGAIFSSDPFIYLVLSAVVEIPGATLSIPIITHAGRRLSNVVSYGITGTVILTVSFIPKHITWLITLLSLIGKMAIAASFQIIYLHTSEVFPTEVRTRGMGLADMMSKFGSLCSPFIIDSLSVVWKPAPAVVLGLAALLGCVAVYLLPETKGCSLYDTVASLEAESYDREEILHKERKKDPEATLALTR